MRRAVSTVLTLFAAFHVCAGERASAPLHDFLVPHEKIEVAPQRRLNLFCMGNGNATVLFEAGGSDWSVVWARVQPLVARDARACSYDRAGLGYSDPADGLRSPIELVEDLHALIHKAGLRGPLVLVGHSLGGFQAKLYAALYPRDVAGLVLVEPSEERSWDRTRTALRARFGLPDSTRAELLDQVFVRGLVDRYRSCREHAREHNLDPASDIYRRCTDPPRKVLGDEVAAERRRLQATSAYQAAQAAEIEHSVYGDGAGDPLYADLFRPAMFGPMPLVLLARAPDSSTPPADVLDAIDAVQTADLQAQTVALSSKGEHRAVAGASHHIELDAPEVVAAAVRDVVASAPAH